jgi:predicted alpha/beta-fold hydrolase
LRLALRAPAADLPLVHVAAVCPVLDPARTMTVMESGLGLYHDHFARKWRQSLQRKRALFPEQHDFDDRTLRQGLRELTRVLVERQTEFESLDAYFDGYNIAGDRLARLQVPVSVLTSQDDPVIPVADFKALSLPVHAYLDIARWGGHCGFIRNARLDGFAEDWVAERLAAAADGSLPRPLA